MIYVIWLVISIMLFPIGSVATNFYVGQIATGNGTGVDTNNLCGGLGDANCTPAAGDTIFLCGQFITRLEPQAVDGVDGNPITYEFDCPNNPAQIVLDGTQSEGLLINGRAFLTWNNVRGTGPTANASGFGGIVVTIASDHLVFNRVTVMGNTEDAQTVGAIRGHGLMFGAATTNTLARNVTATDNRGHGIRIQSGNTLLTGAISIVNCVTQRNRRHGVAVDGHATNPALVNGVLIESCLAEYNGDGIYSHRATSVSVRNSTARFNNASLFPTLGESYGIAAEKSPNFLVYGNTVYDNWSDGIEVWGDANIPAINCRVTNNVVFNHVHGNLSNISLNTGIEARTGFSPGCTISGNLLYNNVRNVKIGNDASAASILANNYLFGSTSIYLDDSNETGQNPVTGWEISGNVLSTAGYWIFSPFVGHNVSFIGNTWVGGGVADYNAVEYTAATITLLDPTASTQQPEISHIQTHSRINDPVLLHVER